MIGRTTTVTAPDGTTTTVFDPNGNVTSTTRSGVGTASAVFDALNRVTSSTDVRGKTSSFGYDAAGNTILVTDPLGRTTTFGFDADGRRTSMVDPRGNVAGANPADFRTTWAYDPAGNVTSTTDPLGIVNSTSYDRVGNVASRVNGRGLVTSYVYDAMDRITRVTAPVVGATNWTYSTMGNVLTRTDPLLRVSSWQYDTAQRVTRSTDPLGRFFTYGYNLAGNLVTITDANANAAGNPALGTTTIAYDNLNRPVTKTYSDGTPTVMFSYDTVGRRASMTDGTGTTTYTYDPASRVSSVTTGADVFSYVYDNAGNVTSRSFPDGRTVTATFDDAGQPATINDGTGQVSYGFDPAGNLTTMSFPNGVTQSRTFDRAGRLAAVVNAGPGGPIGGFTYTRDPNGNPVDIDVYQGAVVNPAESMLVTYDGLDRVTRTCFTNTACATANQATWSYDRVGNRLTEKIAAAAQSTYTYDAADQLTAITGPGAALFTYNANGDQLSAGANSFTYNTARQATSATVAGITHVFTYDGNGNRATINSAGAITRELLDTNNPLPVLVAERNPAGAVLRRYTHGTLGEPLRYADTATGAAGWHLTDGIGSVTNITNPGGALTATYRYNTWGDPRPATTVDPAYVTNPLRYTGQQLDPTGHYNLRARHYNPTTSRFTQTDPMPYGPGRAFESPYVYALNNPLIYTDPSGLRGQLSNQRPAQVLACQVTNVGGVMVTTGCSGSSSKGGVLVPRKPQPAPPRPGNKTKVAVGAAAAALAECIRSGLCNPDGSPKRGPRDGGAPPTTRPRTALGACDGPPEDYPGRRTLFHYTSEAGLQGILDSCEINPSLKATSPNDARYGDGQYFSDIQPGSMTNAQLSSRFVRSPFRGARFSRFVEVDVTDLPIKQGRANVFVHLSQEPLNLLGRIVRFGAN